jgi:coproporphyrinogen III oxidase
MISKETIAHQLGNLQNKICTSLELLDGKAAFIEDNWSRAEGGGGRSKVITNGNLLQKGGVMFSAVEGETPETIQKYLKVEKANFFATGVSIVLHPLSPRMPIIHMNIRYFEMSNGTWWFGGGIDVTPIYVVPADGVRFHKRMKAVCDKHHPDFYSKFKTWADDYFFINHRNETRGIGGIFFDRLDTSNTGLTQEQLLAFIIEVGENFAPAFAEIANDNRDLPFTENELRWQALRRGRYVEFNLVYDKGTSFGLNTNGRTESILVSMPPVANWEYNHIPAEESPEWHTLQYLKKGIDWVNLSETA